MSQLDISLAAGDSALAEGRLRAWLIVAASVVGLTFGPSAIVIFSFGTFVRPLSQEFGWSPLAIAFVMTPVSLAIMAVSPVQGFLIDRFGARRIVLISSPLFAAGLLALAFMPGTLWTYYALYTALALLAVGLWPASYLRVVSTWFDKNLGLAVGIANGGIGIGAAILPLMSAYLIAAGTWRAGYVGLAVIVMVVTLPLNLWLLHEKKVVRPGAWMAADGLSFGEIVCTGSFLLLLFSFFLLGVVNTGLIAQQVSVLIGAGLTPLKAAVVQSAFGAALFAARFVTGALLDRIRAPLVMSTVCAGGVVACALYAAGVSSDVVFLCSILIGAVVGAEFDVLSFLVKRYFGNRSFGRTYGVIFAVFQLGAALGATVLPLSRSMMGSYAPGLIVYATALAFAAIGFLQLGPYRFGVGRTAEAAA